MTQDAATGNEPLWLLIEDRINELSSGDLEGDRMEATIQRVATDLDGAGVNVTKHGGNMLKLRWAMQATLEVGRPFLADFDGALAALPLGDVADPYLATTKLIGNVGKTWPGLKETDRRPDVQRIVTATRLDLLVAHAKTLEGDEGVRYLYVEEVAAEVVTGALGISEAKYEEVKAAVEAERAERVRVAGLLENRHPQPGLGQQQGREGAHRPVAHDDDVVVGCGHG